MLMSTRVSSLIRHLEAVSNLTQKWGPRGQPSFPCARGAAPRWSRQGWGVTALLSYRGHTAAAGAVCQHCRAVSGSQGGWICTQGHAT